MPAAAGVMEQKGQNHEKNSIKYTCVIDAVSDWGMSGEKNSCIRK